MLKRSLVLMSAVVLLSGCFGSGDKSLSQPSPGVSAKPSVSPSASTEPSTAPSSSPDGAKPSPGTSVKPSPLPPLEGKDTVSIVLDSEPRLRSPINTVVPPTPQTFTITFKEAMDRKSVEKSLIDFNKPDPQTPLPKEPLSFKFDWKNDKELKLTVAPALLEGKNEPVTRVYRIYFQGAQTLSGKTLKEPPGFGVNLHTPIQLWRVSADGATREKLTDWKEPFYHAPVLPLNPRYAIAKRFVQYCECDAPFDRLTWLYDLQDKKLVSYPEELVTNYMGPGEFMADKRGFFFAKPKAGSETPGGTNAASVQVDGYVWGTAWSKDGKHVLMAVSASEDKPKDLDLVLWNSETGAQTRKSGVLKGEVPESDLDSRRMPVEFKDDGAYAYTTLIELPSGKPLRYRYEWKSGAISTWKLPFADEHWWVDFQDSGDGLYRAYSNGRLYKKGVLVDEKAPPAYSGYYSWLKGTHKLATIEYDHKDPSKPMSYLALYDADTGKRVRILEQLPGAANLAGTSGDGKWIYLQTSEPLPAK